MATLTPNVTESIHRTITENPVVLYMKGTRDAPQCGFSARVVQILDGLLPEYRTVDVLANADVREGIKQFSSWPTIPQLFVNGEFIGGADIVAALSESGELKEKLAGLGTAQTAKVTMSERARAELGAALEGAEECVRLEVSPKFEHDLAVGIPDPRDVIIDVGRLRISMPPSSVRRADGIHIDVVDTPDGPAFKIDNPNEPPRVKRLSGAELKQRLARGDELLLVDVRTPAERAIASIEGGRALDAELRAEIERSPRDRSIVVYCHHGVRSLNAAEVLAAQGFRDVYNLVGGIDAWSQEVDPDVPRY
jgi:monothiol glutaredoxin